MKIGERYHKIVSSVQINIPFRMLVESYLPIFVTNRFNPEIGLDADALDNFSRSDYESIAAALAAYGPRITLHGPFIDLSAGSKDPRIRDVTRQRLVQVLDLIPIFKPITLVCHAGYDTKRYNFFREEWLRNSLDLWSWFAGELNARGVRLMLENVYEKDPRDLLDLLEGLASENVGLCLDTGHLWSFGQSSPETWLDCLGNFIGQFHLHDNDRSFDQHLGMGTGSIDFDPVWRYIQSRKQNPPVVTLEPHEKEDLLNSLAYLESYADILSGR